jgi:Lar family restriction alleviation protein
MLDFCPFCGSDDLNNVEGMCELKYIICHNCGAEGPKYMPNATGHISKNESEEDAKNTWNSRKGVYEILEKIQN